MSVLPGAAVSESRLVPLRSEADPYLAVAQARHLARSMGFDTYATTEIETAVSELARNVLQHGVEGAVWLRRLGRRLEVSCLDRGPGFGATTLRPPAGLGVGLAGARRLMDGLIAEDRPGGGARVTAWRSVPLARERASARLEVSDVGDPFLPPAALQAAVALRAAEGESACGDGYAVLPTANGVLLAGVDGVGRGPAAAEAAAVALEVLTEKATAEPYASLPELLEAAHRACRRGRGAVAGLVRIAPTGATWAGVGNVRVHGLGTALKVSTEGTLDGGWDGYRLGSPGCLGVRWPEPAPREEPLSPWEGLLLATDGVPPEAVEAVFSDWIGAGAFATADPSGAAGGPVTSDAPAAALRQLAEEVLARAESGDDGLVLVASSDRTPEGAGTHRDGGRS